MKVILCENVTVIIVADQFSEGHRLRCRLLEDHAGGRGGDYVITSRLRSIDFDKGIAITQNNIYKFKPGADNGLQR